MSTGSTPDLEWGWTELLESVVGRSTGMEEVDHLWEKVRRLPPVARLADPHVRGL